MEVCRITTGNVRLRPELVSVNGIVARAVKTAQPLIAQCLHQLDVQLPPQPMFLYADASRLEQVLVNLLTNAAQYTDEGERIWPTVELEQVVEGVANGAETVPMAAIRVRDTGNGMAPELLPFIFDLFTQAEKSLDRSQDGLGIGLCLVQRLVELHGETVKARSVLGQGSKFVVRLPLMLTDLPASPTFPSSSLEIAQSPKKSCRVLVVNDNVDAAQSLAKLLDIGLFGLSGYEVAQQIRQQPALGRTRLVALTGYE